MNDFGTVLKNLRKERGITQRELADKVGIDFTYVSKIENGRLENPPAEKTILEIAKVLEIDADELMLLAKKVPEKLRETVVEDDLAVDFLRKLPRLSPEQRKKIKNFIDEM